jgi:hypothetical protein
MLSGVAQFPFVLLLMLLPVPLESAPALALSKQEQKIVEALLTSESISDKHFLCDRTSVPFAPTYYATFARDVRKEAKNFDLPLKEALEDFLAKYKTNVLFRFENSSPSNIELVSDQVLNEIFSVPYDAKPNGWTLFYRRFPNADGLSRISRIGIDKKGTVAILYSESVSNYLSGSSGIRVLRLKDGKWEQSHERLGFEAYY